MKFDFCLAANKNAFYAHAQITVIYKSLESHFIFWKIFSYCFYFQNWTNFMHELSGNTCKKSITEQTMGLNVFPIVCFM